MLFSCQHDVCHDMCFTHFCSVTKQVCVGRKSFRVLFLHMPDAFSCHAGISHASHDRALLQTIVVEKSPSPKPATVQIVKQSPSPKPATVEIVKQTPSPKPTQVVVLKKVSGHA